MSLADEQSALVAALVSGRPLPAGFDPERVRVARDALLHKRSGEVAAVWPVLAASLGPQWTVRFREWARDHPPRGAYHDGLDFALALAASGQLPGAATAELRARTRARGLTWVRRWWRNTTRRWSSRRRRAR
jgi:hypothetical protein